MTAQEIETRAELAPGDMGYATLPAGLTTAETIAYHKGFTRADRAFIKSTGGPGVVHDGDAPAAGTAARRMLAQTLAENGRAYRLARHDKCHAGGMSAVRSYLRKIGAIDRLAELETRPARKPRKAPALAVVETPAPVDIVTAAVDSGRMVIIPVGAESVPEVVLHDVNRAPIPFIDCFDCGTRDYLGESHTCVSPESADPEITIPAPMPNMIRAARKASNRELAAAMRAAGVKITPESWAAAKAGTLAELVSA